MARLDKLKGGHHTVTSKKYQDRIVEGGIICTMCKKVRKREEYHNRMGGHQSYCKVCSSEMNKKRHKKTKYKLW
jgi:uncharacterized CHY-type Zn-finger protein